MNNPLRLLDENAKSEARLLHGQGMSCREISEQLRIPEELIRDLIETGTVVDILDDAKMSLRSTKEYMEMMNGKIKDAPEELKKIEGMLINSISHYAHAMHEVPIDDLQAQKSLIVFSENLGRLQNLVNKARLGEDTNLDDSKLNVFKAILKE